MTPNEIICGDCLEVMKDWPDNSFDAVVTDIPYGIGFMGKEWDTFMPEYVEKMKRQNAKRPPRTDGRNVPIGGIARDSGTYDFSRNAEYQEWCRLWSAEALRVARPGAFLLCFGGTRTYHRVTCGLEDAGWQIRDCMMWLYGSGFPKSLNISKAIDKAAPRQGMFEKFAQHFAECRKSSGLSQKDIARHFPSKTGGLTGCVWNWENGSNIPTVEQWYILQPMLKLSNKFLPLIERVETERKVIGKDKNWGEKGDVPISGYKEFDITAPASDLGKLWDGYGTALKPAWEPIIVAMKPLNGTFAANAEKWGVAGLNIDGGRIGAGGRRMCGTTDKSGESSYVLGAREETRTEQGRWPANVILDEDFIPILSLTNNIEAGILQAIKEYYYDYKLPNVPRKVSGLSEQTQTKSGEVLQPEMLLEVAKQKPKGRNSPDVWEETQSRSNSKDETATSKAGQGKSSIQGRSLGQGLSLYQSSGTESSRIGNGTENDLKRNNNRTSTNNGGEDRKAIKAKRDCSSQKRAQSRQQNSKFRDNKQHKSYPRTSQISKRSNKITSRERILEVLACDIPENWLKYFEPTGEEIRNPNCAAAMLDEQSGVSKSTCSDRGKGIDGATFAHKSGSLHGIRGHIDSGGASRFFYCAKASRAERNAGLEGMEKKKPLGNGFGYVKNPMASHDKSRDEMHQKIKNHHPTVKPLALMEYLCKLLRPPGKRPVLLDPFCGSGTTLIAAYNTGWDYVGIEKEPEYVKIAEKRINKKTEQYTLIERSMK